MDLQYLGREGGVSLGLRECGGLMVFGSQSVVIRVEYIVQIHCMSRNHVFTSFLMLLDEKQTEEA